MERINRQLILHGASKGRLALKQVARAIETVKESDGLSLASAEWLKALAHYRGLTLRVVDQAQRRVFPGDSVPAFEKSVWSCALSHNVMRMARLGYE